MFQIVQTIFAQAKERKNWKGLMDYLRENIQVLKNAAVDITETKSTKLLEAVKILNTDRNTAFAVIQLLILQLQSRLTNYASRNAFVNHLITAFSTISVEHAMNNPSDSKPSSIIRRDRYLCVNISYVACTPCCYF